MSKATSGKLHKCLKASDSQDVEKSYVQIIKDWLDETKIYDRIHFRGHTDAEWNQKKALLQQFTINNFMFCTKAGLSEIKMCIVMEILHYLMR